MPSAIGVRMLSSQGRRRTTQAEGAVVSGEASVPISPGWGSFAVSVAVEMWVESPLSRGKFRNDFQGSGAHSLSSCVKGAVTTNIAIPYAVEANKHCAGFLQHFRFLRAECVYLGLLNPQMNKLKSSA